MQVHGHYLQRYGLSRPAVGARNLHFDPAAHDGSDTMAGAHTLSPSDYPQWQRLPWALPKFLSNLLPKFLRL